MKSIPYSKSNFEFLVQNGYYYQDKTQYLKELESITTAIYLRPRRFGKTLFTNMLNYYYGIDQADKFDELFGELHVHDHPTELKNQYYILNFDFSGTSLSANDNIEEIFNSKVIAGAKRFINRYKLEIKLEDTKTPARTLLTLLNDFLGLNLSHKIYIMIDEYDHLTNTLLKGDGKEFLDVTSKGGFVRGFYEIIKEYMAHGCVERFFATGILSISLDSMSSGFNIAEDISLEPEFSAMIGFTHEEVNQIIKETITNPSEQLFEELRYNYDGYRFSEMNEELVFNSTLVMYYLKHYKKHSTAPRVLIDKNLNATGLAIKSIVELKNTESNYKLIEELITKNELLGRFVPYFDLEKRWGRYDLITALFHLGLLTIKDVGMMTKFRIPNSVMRKIYFEYLIEMLERKNKYKIESFEIEMAVIEFGEQGDIVPVAELVKNFLIHTSVRDTQNFNEMTLKFLFANLFKSNSQYSVFVEYPSKLGFIDLFIQKAPGSFATFEGMIELKYLSKKEGTEARIHKELSDGRTQILRYMDDERIQKDNLKKFVIVFVGFEKYICEEIE